ncbi:MAG TPA: NUDIX domain-containing protein [Chloroflexota bacterium]
MRGNGHGRVRRVLAIGAGREELKALRAEDLDLRAGDLASLATSAEHELDGVWLGRREYVEADALAASFRALHHGFVRVPIDWRDPCDRLRLELLLVRADFEVVEAADTGLVGWTKLVTPKIGAAAVVFDPDGRVLLTDRADGRGWCLPGGYADPHEPPQETAVREAREETGLEVETERLLGVYSVTLRDGGKIVACAFICRVVGGEPTLTDETVGFGWFGEHELPEPIFGTHRLRLRDAFAVRRGEAEPPFVRDAVEPP